MMKKANKIKQEEAGTEYAEWTIRKFASEEDYLKNNPYATEDFAPNLLLNEGITELLTLMCTSSGVKFDNANAHIGVGDSDAAEVATQTGLQATTNKLYKAMDSTFPQVSGQTVNFRATFGANDANYNWREFSISNSNSDAGKNLNRKVSNQGTKVQSQVWEVTLSITLS